MWVDLFARVLSKERDGVSRAAKTYLHDSETEYIAEDAHLMEFIRTRVFRNI